MKKLIGGLAALTMIAGGFVLQAGPAGAKTSHCVDHATEVKVLAEDSPATVDVLNSATGELISVIITISGTGFTIEPADPGVVLTDSEWCIKSSTNTNDGSGTSGESTSTNSSGIVQDISYVVVYSVRTGMIS